MKFFRNRRSISGNPFLSKPAGKQKSQGKPQSQRASAGKSKSPFHPLRLLRKLVLFVLVSSVATVVLFRFVPPPITPLMAIRCVQQWKSGGKIRLHKNWRSLDRISPNLVEAVVASEDQLFLDHW